jgi:hypothetical protein
MIEEPWLRHLGMLDDDQYFAVAVVLVVNVLFVRGTRAGQAVLPIHVHLSATAGCGKTTVLNVVG